MNKSDYLKLDSDKLFFDLFNKKSYKCSGVMIPDTITVNQSGIITSWYFISSKLSGSIQTNYSQLNIGPILKKNLEKL
jgi:hypothetical protein